MGYGRGYTEYDEAALARLTPQQRAVLEPPYATRLERPLVTSATASDAQAPPAKKARSQAKKDLDKAILGTSYF